MEKKIFYISLLLLIIIVIVAGILLYIQRTNNPAFDSCLNEWKAKNLKYTDYVAGTIFVHFRPIVTEEQAKQLIERNGLSISRSYFTENYPTKNKTVFNAEIKVPVNSEFKWVCKFQIDALVDMASVLYK